MYLPLDTAKNAKKFIEKINPKLVFFIKYEFWFHYLNTLKQKEIPTYLVSGIFRKNQLFFKSYGVFLKNMLQTFHHLFVQDIASANLLKSIGITQYSITNDTRFDQVLAIKNQAKKYDTISKFIGNKPCLILGSSWIKDELFFSKIITQLTNYQIIIAPHQIDKTRINAIQALFKSNVLYSELDEQNFATHCLIIDNIGMLSSLYFYATIVYIGGGFGVSIHNILEATIYEKPVLFGPAHQKMKEAKDLLQLGGAFEIKNEVEILETIHHLENTENYNHSSKICAEYMHNNLGATEKIIQFLKKEAKL